MSLEDELSELDVAMVGFVESMLEHTGSSDNPLNTISVELSQLEVLTIMLGLNRIVGDERIPEPARAICTRLVDRCIHAIVTQKADANGKWPT